MRSHPSTPGDTASGTAALKAALLVDFGGDVTWCYALPGATFAHAAGAVCSTLPAWGLAPDDDGLVVANLVSPTFPDPAPALEALGLLPPGTPALPLFTSPPPPVQAGDGSPLPPAIGMEPLLGAFTCPASGRAWLLRRRARRTLGDALRFGCPATGAPFFSPPAARLILFQVASAVTAALAAGLPPSPITPDDVLLGDGCARATVAPAALLRPTLPASSTLPAWVTGGAADATTAWVDGSLSTLDYLLRLQVLAGRRWGDPRAHPFLPWVLRDLREAPPPATSTSTSWVRDLTRTQWRLVKGDAQLDASFEAAASPRDAHHVPAPTPLGELGFCVALARSLPRSTLTARVRRGWQPGEYPASLARLAAWTADEAVPELYCGDGRAAFESTHPDLPDLALPAWAADAPSFLAAHGAALESEAVAAALPAWIDLTFGVDLVGPAAIAAKNAAPPRPPGAGLPGVGRCQLFTGPHPHRRSGLVQRATGEAQPASPIAPWDDGLVASAPGGQAALGRLAVLISSGRLSPLAPGDEAGWAAAAASLADTEAAKFASACLMGQLDVNTDPFFTPAIRAATTALLQQADAEAAARAAGAGAGVAAAAGLAAAAGGRSSALTNSPAEAWNLACPALLTALGRAFAGAAHTGCSSTDTAGANAAAAALGVLLGRAPWGVLSSDAIPAIGRLLAAGSAVVAAGGGGAHGLSPLINPTGDDPATTTPPRDRAPTMLSALLSRPCISAALATGGLVPYLGYVHAHALDCLLLAGVKEGGSGGVAAAAAAAMGEVAARLPLPATLEWVVRPLILALTSGAPGHAAAGLAAVGKAVGGEATGRHLVPPLVSILSSRVTSRATTDGGGTCRPTTLPSAGAVTALEGLIPLLTRAGAAAVVASRPTPDGRLAPARLAGPLLDPAAYAPLAASVRVRLGNVLVAAADVAAGEECGGPAAGPFVRDLLPQLLSLFRALPAARAAFGQDDKASEEPASASPASDVASRLAEAMAVGLVGVVGGARNGPAAAQPPSPASEESGWWRLAATLYVASVAHAPAPALRTLVPGWVSLEQGVPRVLPGWVSPPLEPPGPADTALAGEVGRAADRLAGRPGQAQPRRRATVEEAAPAPTPSDEGVAARAAALISGVGWSHPAVPAAVEAERAAGSASAPLALPKPEEASSGRWGWLPPGLAPPPTPDAGDGAGWGSPAAWSAGPPRSMTALLGLSSKNALASDRGLSPLPWAVQARPLHAWRAHRDRLRAVAVDDDEGLVVTAGKAGPRRGGGGAADAGSGPGPTQPPGRDSARVWTLADGRAGGEYTGHTARIVALSMTAGPSPAVASLDEGGALHVWRSTAPGGGGAWVVGRPGESEQPSVLVVEAGAAPPPPARPLPGFTCVARSGDGGLGGTAFVTGTADGRVGLADAGAQAPVATTAPGALWGGRAAVSALHTPPGCAWTATGSAAGHVAVVDGRCGPGSAVVAAWSAHSGGAAVTALLAAPPLLVTAGADRVLRVWDLRACGGGDQGSPTLLHAWTPLKSVPTGLAPAPGGGALAHAGPSLVALPPLHFPADPFPPSLPSVRAAPPRTAVAGLAILPWSRLLVLGCDDGHVLVCK